MACVPGVPVTVCKGNMANDNKRLISWLIFGSICFFFHFMFMRWPLVCVCVRVGLFLNVPCAVGPSIRVGTVHRLLFWVTSTCIRHESCDHPRDHWALWCTSNGPISTTENGKDGWMVFVIGYIVFLCAECLNTDMNLQCDGKNGREKKTKYGHASAQHDYFIVCWLLNVHFNFLRKSKIARDFALDIRFRFTLLWWTKRRWGGAVYIILYSVNKFAWVCGEK